MTVQTRVLTTTSMDGASARLAQLAINGNSLGEAEIVFLDLEASSKPVVTARYRLERVFVKSWSTSGDADDRPTEEVASYYNKITFTYSPAGARAESGGWDLTRNVAY